MKYCILLVLVGLLEAAPKADIVTEIKRGLDGRNDIQNLLQYLEMSDEELIADLPVKNEDGGYTLFAPTDEAFSVMRPADVGDPYYDPDLRLGVLLRHFVRRRLTKEELVKSTSLTMANGEIYQLTHDQGTTTIHGATILQESVQLPDVSVFFVDRAFVTSSEISEALSRHPVEWSFFGPLPATPYEKLPPFPNGGYNRVSVERKDVTEAAEFAAKTQSMTLLKIKSAGEQSFYGHLFKLGLELKAESDESRSCQAVVFKRGDEIKLSSFDCFPM